MSRIVLILGLLCSFWVYGDDRGMMALPGGEEKSYEGDPEHCVRPALSEQRRQTAPCKEGDECLPGVADPGSAGPVVKPK